MFRLISLLCCSIILLFATNVLAADIIPLPIQKLNMSIIIQGKIERGDAERFNAILNLYKKDGFSIARVLLDSQGGDVFEAIKIGKLIRQNYIQTVIGTFSEGQQKCLSACFFIWAAGVHRTALKGVESPLGVHRPYFPKEHFKGLNASEAKSLYEEMSFAVSNYLKIMNIPSTIIDSMFSHSSNDIYYLDKKTLLNLKNVPFFGEWVLANCGELTKQERKDLDELFHKDIRTDGNLTNAESFYYKSLSDKELKIRKCKEKLIFNAQQKQ